MQKVRLGDISKLNAETFKMNFDKIYYLDTSSVTKGRFDKFSVFENGAKLPSRAKRAVKDKTIVYSTVRPNLQHFGILKEPSKNIVVSTGFTTIDVKDFVDAKYIYYFLTQNAITNKLHTIASNNVSSYPSIKPSDLENIELTLPTLLVQQKISKVLTTIDEKIELNHKINAKLEQIAQKIYEYWFLQFDFPDENNNPYRSNGGNMLYNSEMNYQIPENWKVKKLSEIIDNQKSGDWGKSSLEKNYLIKVNVIRGADLSSLLGEKSLEAPERFILEKKLDKQLEVGDFIIEISGGGPTQSTGRIAYINQGVLDRFDLPVLSSNFTKAISLTNENLFNLFYLYWKKLYENDAFYKYEGKTSGIKNLLFERFIKENYIVIPPSELLFKFESITKPIFQKIQQNNLESKKLEDQRDYLLPMLINGQINVDDIQID